MAPSRRAPVRAAAQHETWRTHYEEDALRNSFCGQVAMAQVTLGTVPLRRTTQPYLAQRSTAVGTGIHAPPRGCS
eukprot:8286658-Pyramimonas_sp.AAC.1